MEGGLTGRGVGTGERAGGMTIDQCPATPPHHPSDHSRTPPLSTPTPTTSIRPPSSEKTPTTSTTTYHNTGGTPSSSSKNSTKTTLPTNPSLSREPSHTMIQHQDNNGHGHVSLSHSTTQTQTSYNFHEVFRAIIARLYNDDITSVTTNNPHHALTPPSAPHAPPPSSSTMTVESVSNDPPSHPQQPLPRPFPGLFHGTSSGQPLPLIQPSLSFPPLHNPHLLILILILSTPSSYQSSYQSLSPGQLQRIHEIARAFRHTLSMCRTSTAGGGMPYLWLPQTREFVPMPRGFVPSSSTSSSSTSSSSTSSSSSMSTLMNSGKNPPHIESTSVSGKGNHQHPGQSATHTTPFSTLAGGIFPLTQRDLVTLCHVIGPQGVRILDEEITTMIHHLSTTIIETFLITNQMLLKEVRQDVHKGMMWNPIPLISSMQLATASMKV